jgi:isoleucyl-tRNA synthetase
MRQGKEIGNSLEAEVKILCLEQDMADFLLSFGPEALSDLFIVSKTAVEVVADLPDDSVQDERSKGVGIHVRKTSETKCERCWKYTGDVGTFNDHPTICGRCREVLEPA